VQVWKVGELAARTGLTVRTLHHYDEIGLLRPARRTASGHRLYGESEVERLQRIVSLRQAGFGLEDIVGIVDGPDGTLDRALARQIEHLHERIARDGAVLDRLEELRQSLRANGSVPVDAMFELMEVMMRVEDYYTPEQLEYLKRRGEQLGEETIRSVEREWPELIAKMKSAMERGVDPASEEVRALAKRWGELVEMFTGGDAGVTQSLSKFHRDRMEGEGGFMGIDSSLMGYVGRAMRR
jgi:MerR family transcriptional regulator, thiopeptide resistance regulator